MKFTNGCWVDAENTQIFSPAQVYEYSIEPERVRLLCPTGKITSRGATLGGVFGSLLTFNLEGLEFVMTALLLVIFLNNWVHEKRHATSLIGLAVTALCLAVFGPSDFIIPAMLGILAVLTAFRGPLERAVDETC